ncbi:MAG: bifunctional folylpolyglutamate synthase/dihydrofolate synthase [Bacteroidales bacterium]|nr:bifunctional folylpolyglutamate synthase/dihydrofolate synthase [Bacteroidales bacterium]
MNYEETINYLFTFLPMFQRIGAAAYKSDLSNTIALMEALDNPQNKFKSIHVAGTNGKGSTSHLLASLLREKGLKVGLHTSPHLKDFRERIRVNGVMVEKDWVVDFVEKNKSIIEEIQPSFFETAVAMTFKYFEEQKVDVAIIEVGMGGRLDSTNVLSPLLSVITNISFDHTEFLGKDLASIAGEKAGIIKDNTPVVIGQTQEETAPVFIKRAKEHNSNISFADQIYSIRNPRHIDTKLMVDVYKKDDLLYKDLVSVLSGNYQLKNITTVICAIEELGKIGYCFSEEELRTGFLNLQTNAPLMGRWQTLSTNPLTICDTGHNEDGLSYVIEQINQTPYNNLHFVLGMVNDKDIDKVLSMLPKKAHYYLCKADIPRGLDVEILAEKTKQAGLIYSKYKSVKEALDAAQRNAKENDLVFVGGSTYTVAEIV